MDESRTLVGSYRSHVLGDNGKPVLQFPSGWKGLILERLVIPTRKEYGPQFSGMPVVFASQYSPGRRWYRCNGKTQEIPLIAPGMDFLSANYERDYERWECDPGGETLCLRLHPSVVERYMHEDAHHFDLETRYCRKDEQLLRHVFSLADEMQRGMPDGMLFAEGLSLAIIGLLSQHYSQRPKRVLPQTKSLSSEQQARIRELIDTQIDADLSIERLASEVFISPFHFARLFRSTFGMPPHRYVVQTRVARAAQLMSAEASRTITDIALATGFSNHAHLTREFKRQMGQTPASWRVS